MISLKDTFYFRSCSKFDISDVESNSKIMIMLELVIPINKTIKINNKYHPLIFRNINSKIEHMIILSLKLFLIQVRRNYFILPIRKCISYLEGEGLACLGIA